MDVFKVLSTPQPSKQKKQQQTESQLQIEKVNLNVEKRIKFIKYGSAHIIFITVDNEVFVYGNNYNSQLGIGHKSDTNNEFIKLNLNIGNILFLETNKFFTIIVNDKHEFYFSGYLKNHMTCKTFTKLSIQKITEKIKFIRIGINSMLIVISNNNIDSVLHYGKIKKFTNIEDIELIEEPENILQLKIKDIQFEEHRMILLSDSGLISYSSNYMYHFTKNEYLRNCDFFQKHYNYKINVIKIVSRNSSTILLTDLNELYILRHDYLYQYSRIDFVFTPIIVHKDFKEIVNINVSDDCIIVTTSFNEIYCFGKHNILLNEIKKVKYKKEGELVKINNLKFERQHLYPLVLNDELFFVSSIYEINKENSEPCCWDTYLGNLFLQKAKNEQLVDIILILSTKEEDNCKKRKRNIFETI